MNLKKINVDLGILFIRLSAALMIPHGLKKMIFGHDYIKQTLVEKGFPELLWLGVPFCEFLAPLLILFGVFTRISAGLLVFVMLFALYLSHLDHLFNLNPENGALAIENNLLFIFAGVSLIFTGAGKYSLYKSKNGLLK